MQSRQLLQALKKELRARGITYAKVAKKLDLSEASVKRLFSAGGFTLERFEAVCELAGLSISELIEINLKNQHKLEQLTRDQEKEIAGDLVLLVVAISVMNGMTFQDIVGHYRIPETECIRKLARLDRLKFLELLPGNRFRLLLSPTFRWQKDGPIQQFFLQKVEKEFFNSRFQKETEKLLVLNGLCTPATNQRIQDRMERLSLEIADLIKQDMIKPLPEKRGNTVVIALREWQFNLFATLARERDSG